MQTLLASVVDALESAWGASVRHVRHSPIVPVRENYDRLGYHHDDVTAPVATPATSVPR